MPAARAAEAPPAVAVRPAADYHFIAGFDHLRAGRFVEARRDWNACLELDATHDFCEFGLTVLDARAPKPAGAEAPSVTAAPPEADSREAQQNYLEGVIYFQKGDYDKARASWRLALALSPKGSDVAADAQAGLRKLDQLGAAKVPESLKAAEPEKKDEHQALQTYFTGLIHYQKGDLDRARTEWKRAKALAPEGSSVMSDAKAALEKLDKEEASTRPDRKK